ARRPLRCCRKDPRTPRTALDAPFPVTPFGSPFRKHSLARYDWRAGRAVLLRDGGIRGRLAGGKRGPQYPRSGTPSKTVRIRAAYGELYVYGTRLYRSERIHPDSKCGATFPGNRTT